MRPQVTWAANRLPRTKIHSEFQIPHPALNGWAWIMTCPLGIITGSSSVPDRFMAEMFPKEDLIATMRCQQGALLPCKLDWPIHHICYWGGQPTDSRPAASPLWHDLWHVGWQKES